MGKKYYAIKRGRKPGIYTDWPTAQAQVKGFSGAVYKSFTDEMAASDFLTEQQTVLENDPEDRLIAYVDGSFNASRQTYGSGVVLLFNGEVLATLSQSGNDQRFLESFQIAGEVLAALAAIQWAQEHGYQALMIHYDYQGIEAWATGVWQAKKTISQEYRQQFIKLTTDMQVDFVKVKAHSGVHYNEMADQLAKAATLQ